MMEAISTLNYLLALGGILAFLSATVLIVDLRTSRIFAMLVRGWGLLIAFALTLLSSIMALVYSDVFGFVPCGLCWLQRVFLFPQIFIMGAAVYMKDTRAAVYGTVLSAFGFTIGLYQHYLQMGGSELVACPTAGTGADCAQRILFEFGFVTFPLISAALFALLVALYIYILQIRKFP